MLWTASPWTHWCVCLSKAAADFFFFVKAAGPFGGLESVPWNSPSS